MQTPHPSNSAAETPILPVTPVQRWTRPLVHFLHLESASGVLLLCCTVVALVLANSAWGESFAALWNTPISITIGGWPLIDAEHHSLRRWINDGLMTIFFFVVGLEIKRELVAGELRDPRKAALPAFAALGGMLVPAAVYLIFQYGQEGHQGWGIPMATDIAFVVGVLALLGPRVPLGLKILLLSLAIVDDIGAILIIAVAYSSNIALTPLLLAAAGFMVIYGLNRIGVRRVPVYLLVGACIWYAMLKSGIHPTVAGVLLGLLTPASAWIGEASLLSVVSHFVHHFGQGVCKEPHTRPAALNQLAMVAQESVSPLQRLEVSLHPWVAFVIMPLFALANAGVALNLSALSSPVTLAVAAGLCVGKPIGIFLFSWGAVRLGLARLPAGVNWMALLGAGCLGGIGFTMSIFITGLALQGPLQDAGKIGTLLGSLLSAAVGSYLLLRFLPQHVAVNGDPDESPKKLGDTP